MTDIEFLEAHIKHLKALIFMMNLQPSNKQANSELKHWGNILKKLKALEIVKEYQVDVWLLKQCDYENYIRIRKECLIETEKIKNEEGLTVDYVIPEEDFNYLKEVL